MAGYDEEAGKHSMWRVATLLFSFFDLANNKPHQKYISSFNVMISFHSLSRCKV